MQLLLTTVFAAVVLLGNAHELDHDQVPLGYVRFPMESTYRTRNGEGMQSIPKLHLPELTFEISTVTADAIFSGITTFAKLPWVQCLTRESTIPFDIAFIGAPFVRNSSRQFVFVDYSDEPCRIPARAIGLEDALDQVIPVC